MKRRKGEREREREAQATVRTSGAERRLRGYVRKRGLQREGKEREGSLPLTP
jgi:hypothetical protein